MFGESQEEMVEDLDKGDVAETVKSYFEQNSRVKPQTKSTLSNHEVCLHSYTLHLGLIPVPHFI